MELVRAFFLISKKYDTNLSLSPSSTIASSMCRSCVRTFIVLVYDCQQEEKLSLSPNFELSIIGHPRSHTYLHSCVLGGVLWLLLLFSFANLISVQRTPTCLDRKSKFFLLFNSYLSVSPPADVSGKRSSYRMWFNGGMKCYDNLCFIIKVNNIRWSSNSNCDSFLTFFFRI